MLIIKTFKLFNYQHLFVGVAGFEPTTPCSQSRCANRTALHPELIFSKQLLKIFLFFVGVAGFEPTTPCSQSRCANRTARHPELVFFKQLLKIFFFSSSG